MSNKIFGFLPVSELLKVKYADVSSLKEQAFKSKDMIDFAHALGMAQVLLDDLFDGFFEKRDKEVKRYE